MKRKKIDVKQSVEDFFKQWQSKTNTALFRQAVAKHLKNPKYIDWANLRIMRELLEKWFTKRLYRQGTKRLQKIEVLADRDDYGHSVGVGFSVEAKKGKVNIGHYLMHLLILIEAQKRDISNLRNEVSAGKENLLDYEKALIKIIKCKKKQKGIEKIVQKFYWLFPSEEWD